MVTKETNFVMPFALLDRIVTYLKTQPWGEVDDIMQQIRGLQALAPVKNDPPKPPVKKEENKKDAKPPADPDPVGDGEKKNN